MFQDRVDAGEKLVPGLRKFQSEECVVMAIPRGGVVLGEVIAKELHCPLGLVLVRKIGHPNNPEYAVCAVSESGMKCSEEEKSGLEDDWLKGKVEEERQEIKRRKEMYLGGRPMVDVSGKTVILVDDGIATGLTYLMAVDELRSRKPKKIVAALPVMPAEFEPKLREVVDEIVCLKSDPNYLGAVGSYYMYFPQLTDEEVVRAMKSA
jgi:putative phosphoribosyl transferase